MEEMIGIKMVRKIERVMVIGIKRVKVGWIRNRIFNLFFGVFKRATCATHDVTDFVVAQATITNNIM